MDFKSLFRSWAKRRNTKINPKQKKRPRMRLNLEQLEVRELPAGTPIAITAVTPANGTFSPSSLPAIQVTFNQDVDGADNPFNYRLFNSLGESIIINDVDYSGPVAGPFVATLTYNFNQPLDVDNYTLFILGDQISGADGMGQLLSLPGQVVTANSGKSNISTMGILDDGRLSAMTNFPVGPLPPPTAIAFADLNRDGFTDLLMVNATATTPSTATLNIFQGQIGGGFGPVPTLSVALNVAIGAGLTTGDFNRDGFPDIAAVSTALDMMMQRINVVSVFLSTGGNFQYAPPANSTVGINPRAIVAADFNGDTFLDLAVANGGTNSDVNNDMVNDYFVTILVGNAAGAFPTSNNIRVGDVGAMGGAATPVSLPTGIAVGRFNPDALPDLAVSGAGGIAVLNNTSTGPANISFGLAVVAGVNTTAIAAGRLRDNLPTTTEDIVAITNLNGGQLLPYQNAGAGAFAPRPPLAANGAPVALAIGDLDGDNFNEVLVANNLTPGLVTVFRNDSGGSIVLTQIASPTTEANPFGFGLFDVNFDGDRDIVTVSRSTFMASVILGNGDTTFQVSDDFALPAFQAGPVVAGDLNADGFPDIVAANPGSNSVSVVLGIGNGDYGLPTAYSTISGGIGFTPSSVAVVDLANSGKLDIVATSQRDGVVTILSPNGMGDYVVVGTARTGSSPTKVVAGDFNGDGRPDLAVSHLGAGIGTGPSGGGNVTILMGNGNRTFQPGTEIAPLIQPHTLGLADFNNDGRLDVVVADNNVIGTVLRFLGDGTGGFVPSGTFAVGANPQSLAIGDVNGDGFIDVVTVSNSALALNNISTLLNAAGGGFSPAIGSNIAVVTRVRDLALVSLNGDLYPDLIVTPDFGGVTSGNNVFTMEGRGDGAFFGATPYAAGGGTVPNPLPTFVAVVADPFVRVTSFRSGGTAVGVNLLFNGNFESRDLGGEQGNLNGWQTIAQTGTPGSRGRWGVQTLTLSPQSSTAVFPPPQGFYQAMLDQAFLAPIIPQAQSFNLVSDFSGAHVLYQDVVIPATATQINLSFALTVRNFAGYSDTTITPALDFNVAADNQQVRVDLVNPNAQPFTTVADNPGTNTAGVYQNLFVTQPGQPAIQFINRTQDSQESLLDVSRYAGKTVRFRIASANNRGQLLVGLDVADFRVRFVDTQAPTMGSVGIRNPSSLASPSLTDPTTDPTVVGKVGDNGSPTNIFFIEFDTRNNGFGQLDDLRTVSLDGDGNFSFTLPQSSLLPGNNTIAIRAVDKLGNQTVNSFSFVLQGPSDVNWSAQGPGAINVTPTGVDYANVSGDITAIAVDPRDATGNTYYIGAANGGIWKTTNGGNDWKVLTDNVVDAAGQPVPVAVGGMALAFTSGPVPSQSGTVIYAGTGVSNNARPSNTGVGVLKSTDDGVTWTLLGQSVLTGARVSKVVVDPTNVNRVYVAVTSFADRTKKPGVFRTIDGGATWTDVFNPVSMFLPGRTQSLASQGIALASVTDLVIDPFTNNRLLAGMGNIGQLNASSAAGLWRSSDGGDTWEQVVGGTSTFVQNSTLPSGTTVGRVTIGMGSGRVGDERFVYVLMGNPPVDSNVTNQFDQGTLLGLFKSKDNMLNFTKVMLKQNIGAGKFNENFVDILILSHDASDFGALAVDPSNPNVVFVGGSDLFRQDTITFEDNPNHGLIRVDTGNMRDTDYFDENNTIPNDGDDATKALIALHPPITPPPTLLRAVNRYDDPNMMVAAPDGQPYTGEGVYWYDLIQAAPNTNGFGQLLPSNVHVLRFDSQGRLLIGTQSGLFRALSVGFGYDQVSGGLGILTNFRHADFGTPLPAVVIQFPGMRSSAINGNLQITEVTGLGIDPDDPTRLYASHFGSGSSFTAAGPLGWQSSGLTGPESPDFLVTGSPNATALRVGGSASGAGGSTFSPVFRAWQAVTVSGNFPEVSTDGGVTFAPVALSGINPNQRTGLDPALAINPTKLFVNGVPHDQLLYGADRVFLTNTSINIWDPISPILSPPTAVLPDGGFVSALAFAPSSPGVYYAGTTDGQVFVQTPGLNWPNMSNGLPGNRGTPLAAKITSITVDPTNDMIAFALLDGPGVPHVFKTVNRGQTWTRSDLLTTGGTLPDFPANCMVIDPRPVPGAPNGRYYLGTAAGVYASLDRGATWGKLGRGLPPAPVVDMQFDAANELLVVATQGRGIFQLSTRTTGPQVTSVTPATPITGAITQVTVTFNEAVDIRTFGINANVAARTNLANALVNTNEYRLNRSVDLYEEYLRRTPTENVQWAANVIQFQGEQHLIATLISSQEYFVNPALGNSNNTTWVNQIYADLLQRSAVGDVDAAGFAAALNAGTTTRSGVALTVATSAEFYADVAAEQFNDILGRNKSIPASFSDPEVSAWQQLFGQGVRFEGLTANLLGSQEYYLNNDGFHALGAGTAPSAVALVNLSGKKDVFGTPILDLVVAQTGTDTVAVFQGRAGGGFASEPAITLTLPAGSKPRGIANEDFNNDGKKDVAVVNSGTDNISVFINSSSGGGINFASLAATNFPVAAGAGPVAIVAGKFNADANIDLAVVASKAIANKFNLYILAGTGTGTFGAATPIDTGFLVALTGVATGDVNGDGNQDFVVSASEVGDAPAGGVRLLRATGPLVYTASLLSDSAASSVAVGKFDTNASLDIAASGAVGSTVEVFQNLTSSPGTFGPPLPFLAAQIPNGITIADFNKDGRNEIVVFSATPTGGLTILLNATTPAGAGLNDTIKFANAVTYPVSGGQPAAAAFGDTNQDLIPDAVLALPNAGAFNVVLGSNNGSYKMPSDERFVVSAYKRLFSRSPAKSEITTQVQVLGQTEQSRLSGPTGSTTPLSIVETDTTTHRSFLLTFAPQTLDGTYILTVGPNTLGNNIKDFTDLDGDYQDSGNAINQNGNLVNGEIFADRYITPLAINTSDNGRFVSGLYHDLLGVEPDGRPPDSAGFVNFLAPVDAARYKVFPTIVPTFTLSVEYRGGLVQGYYVKYLRRASAPPLFGPEVQNWVAQMNAAQISEEGIIATFVSSAEYFQNPSLGNNNNATWLEKAYQDLLGRTTAGDATAASFLAGLNAGTLTRSQITATLVRSDEFLLHVVFANYADLFDRAPVASPDPALSEFLPWLPTLRQTSFPVGGPTPDQQFINALLGSVEYLQHVGNTTRDWASSLYTRVLNRTTVNPNGAEVNNVVAGVINGYAATRHGVATAIAASVEHKNRLVADYYETYLRRSAAPSEITAWANQLFVLRDENVLAAIVSSQEYFPLSGPSSSNAGWVAKVYNDLLKRSSAGDAGATNFVNQLNVVPPAQLGASRGSVAFQLLVSGEYRRLLVASFFNKYLGRNKPIPPSPGDVELNPWVNLLAAGATQEQIIANMLASAEYYLRPHDLP